VLYVRRSKTDASIRTVPLSPETLRRLTLRRSSAERPGEGHKVFVNAFGTPLDPHNFRHRVFKPAARRAGIPWATPHGLRHSMASLMAECGFSPAQIAAHLAHADGGVLALRTYIRVGAIDTPTFVG
jgi:integrase